jgi:hypothetical protein
VQGLPQGAPFPIGVGEGRLSTKKGVSGARTLIIRCNRDNIEMDMGELDKTHLWKRHGTSLKIRRVKASDRSPRLFPYTDSNRLRQTRVSHVVRSKPRRLDSGD